MKYPIDIVQVYRSVPPKVPVSVFKDRMDRMISEDRAYLAGIIDGEGSFGLYLSGTGKQSLSRLTVVTNTNTDLISFVESLIGDEFTNWRKETDTWEPCAAVAISHRELLRILIPVVFPYLVAKRKQAELLLKFIEKRLLLGQHALDDSDRELARTFKEMNGAKSKRYRYGN